MANTPAKAPGLLDLRVAPAPRVRLLVGTGAVALVFVLWFLATLGTIPEHRWISPVILPSPLEVAKSFGPLWTERDLLDSIIATLRRVLAGFGLAIAVGVPLGIVAGSWRVLEAAVMPVALFARNIPVAALIPLTIL
jgi:NitT/TauT family transport system permease protein